MPPAAVTSGNAAGIRVVAAVHIAVVAGRGDDRLARERCTVPRSGDDALSLQLFEIWFAPRLAASLIASASSESKADVASTTRSLHFGHSDETASRSSDSSVAQSGSGRRQGEDPPVWLTFVKQPVVHAGNPYVLRNTARSDSAVGSS